jgi:two-component system nitrogen regulation response regulator NtrX
MSAARILVVDDEADIRSLLREILSEEGYEVEVAADAGQARTARARQAPDLVLLDIWMPDTDGITLLREWSETVSDGCPVVMMSGHGTVETAVEATRLGAFDFVEKPLSLAKLLRTVERALDAGRKRRGGSKLLATGVVTPVGKSRTMQALRAELAQYAALPTAVMLVGESGSGREAFARFLHENSPRASKPFISLVANSLRESDAELALLGREGADGARGLLEQAAGGTLFINDVEDLPAAAQRVLLGMLETMSFTRMGGTRVRALHGAPRLGGPARHRNTRRCHARIAAPRPAFAHLNGLIARVPSLRDYAEDVPDLLRHYVDRLVDSEGCRSAASASPRRTACATTPGPTTSRAAQPRAAPAGARRSRGNPPRGNRARTRRRSGRGEPLVKQDLLALPLREAREQFERAYLQQQLLLCNGKVGQLAKRVGMERTHLYRKLRSLGVDFRNVADEEA